MLQIMACMPVNMAMRSWATLLMPEEQAASVRARLQPPSMSMRSCGHASATADRAVERSFVQLCRLKTCRSKDMLVSLRTVSLSTLRKANAQWAMLCDYSKCIQHAAVRNLGMVCYPNGSAGSAAWHDVPQSWLYLE